MARQGRGVQRRVHRDAATRDLARRPRWVRAIVRLLEVRLLQVLSGEPLWRELARLTQRRQPALSRRRAARPRAAARMYLHLAVQIDPLYLSHLGELAALLLLLLAREGEG